MGGGGGGGASCEVGRGVDRGLKREVQYGLLGRRSVSDSVVELAVRGYSDQVSLVFRVLKA